MKLTADPPYNGRTVYTLNCPGCNDTHTFAVPGWTFNGDMERPTVSPSLLVTCGHYVEGHKPGDSCWCTYNAEHPEEPATFKCHRCHSFIADGRIQFLSDCSHELAGQTVDLPDREAKP